VIKWVYLIKINYRTIVNVLNKSLTEVTVKYFFTDVPQLGTFPVNIERKVNTAQDVLFIMCFTVLVRASPQDWTKSSPQPKRRLDWFSSFCRAH